MLFHRITRPSVLASILSVTLAMALVPALASGCSKGTAADEEDEDPGDGGALDGKATNNPAFTGLGGLDAACVTAKASTELRPAYLMFVVDGSNSMAFEGEAATPSQKWPAMKGALEAIFNDMAAKADPAVSAGMIVFADKSDPTGAGGVYGPYPTSVDIPMGFVDATHATQLKNRLAAGPSGVTPTEPALAGGYKVLESYVPAAPIVAGGAKYVVLMTDGFPFSSIPTDTQVAHSLQMAADELVRPAPQGPIKTIVVGIGDFPGDLVEYNPPFLGDLAVAGGTRATPTCDPKENVNPANVCYFQITPGAKAAADLQKDFTQALDKIRRDAFSCEFIIGAPSDGKRIDPAKLNVVYTPNGGKDSVVAKSDTDGWRYDDPTDPKKVILSGSVCDNYKNARGKVDVFLGCSSVIK